MDFDDLASAIYHDGISLITVTRSRAVLDLSLRMARRQLERSLLDTRHAMLADDRDELAICIDQFTRYLVEFRERLVFDRDDTNEPDRFQAISRCDRLACQVDAMFVALRFRAHV